MLRLLVALAVLTILSAPGCFSRSQSQLRVGEEMMAFDLAEVLELSYRSETLRITAHRWTVGDRFILTVERASDRAFQRCEVPQDSEELLRSLVVIRVARVLQRSEAEQLAKLKPRRGWAEFVIRDSSDLEPAGLLIVATATNAGELFARLPGSPDVIAIDSKPFEVLEQGCTSTSHN